ncbi:MAG: hypothetical protein IPM24_10500 [Bryobacterales bacterium]|jgi:heme-degrading monooxygenase HmoA|nr:hypothetical protein [Bryobacterales bacterium]
MNRRESIQALAAVGAASALGNTARAAANPIQLHVDLEVNPAMEQEMVKNYHATFRPTMSKQPGFVSVTLIKKRQEFGYRLIISFQTEELRKAWVAHDDHQRAWPTIEKCLTGKKFTGTLYDVV